jgi:hypothetical protein
MTCRSTGTVATTVLVVVSMIDRVLLAALATYTRRRSGVTASPHGLRPTGTTATVLFVPVSTTETASRVG